MTTWKLGAAAALALAAAAPAGAQPVIAPEPLAEGRPCGFADIVGLWDSQVVTAKETGAEQHYAALPHDYLRFRADGGMMYYGTNQRETDVPGIHARLDELDRTDGVTYRAEITSNGVLLIRRDGAPFQGFTCTMSGERNGKPVMIWTQLKGFPELRRVQTRLD
ncbi:hypothetical protein [Phenylobacterium sp.]|uniref:hypothetical protein n=1 Tax=Phenylobacterium sp. TaxID=1871053 RepID=UPI0035B2C4D9